MKAEKQNLNSKFLQILSEETELLKKDIAEAIENIGDPMDVKLNKNDKTGDKDQALVHKSKSKTEYKKGPAEKGEEPMDVKLNQAPSKQGSDEKASTAVGVKAGAAKGGNDVLSGQAKANFESKTEGPKAKTGEPFEDKAKTEMNSMDKEVDEGTKTFVDAGAAKGGTDVTAGQAKAGWKESAPKSDNDKRIADAIQLKEKYTKKELQEFIMAEALKKAKMKILENQINSVKTQIKNL